MRSHRDATIPPPSQAESATRPGTAGSVRTGPRVSAQLLDGLLDEAVPGTGTPTLEVRAPWTNEVLGRVPRSSPAGVASADGRARYAQRTWAATSPNVRAAVVRRFAALVVEHQETLLDLIQLETGKARGHAFEEILDVLAVSGYYASVAASLLRTRRLPGALPLLTTAHEVRHPKGVVAVVSPWNYPLTLGISDALPALLAGNAVIAKPDEQTPFTALYAAGLLRQAGLTADALQIVTGYGAELGEAIIEHSDFLMFTGSTRVGRELAATAGRRLKDYAMELGGKNALILLPDADLRQAVPGAVRAAFSNTGQLCISAERMYIPDNLWAPFVTGFVAATEALRIGPGLDFDHDIGSLTSARQLDRVTAHVEQARSLGAVVRTGGRARPDLGPYFYEPTVLTGVRPEMALHSEETFGPVVSLYRVSDTDEAIRRANDSNFGLSFSLWTGDTTAGRHVAQRLHAGTVTINDSHAAGWGSVAAPMGGWKDSGSGSRHGPQGLLKYTNTQTIATQRLLPIARPDMVSPGLYGRVATWLMRRPRRYPAHH